MRAGAAGPPSPVKRTRSLSSRLPHPVTRLIESCPSLNHVPNPVTCLIEFFSSLSHAPHPVTLLIESRASSSHSSGQAAAPSSGRDVRTFPTGPGHRAGTPVEDRHGKQSPAWPRSGPQAVLGKAGGARRSWFALGGCLKPRVPSLAGSRQLSAPDSPWKAGHRGAGWAGPGSST